jgi:sialate O-acetylesterase
MVFRQIPAVAFTLLILSIGRTAALEPASHFSDHMVLQRDVDVPIWGKAKPGAEVTVAFAGQTATARANKIGEWRAILKPLPASATDRDLTITGDGEIKTLRNVLVGDVWLGSGQSNMAGRAGGYAKKDPTLSKLIAAAPYPSIRLLQGGPKPSWEPATEESTARFSALLIAFGERLNRELNVPVGLILGAVGGTPSGFWIPSETFESSEKCRAEIALFGKTWNRERAQKQYELQLAAWEKQTAKAKASGEKVRGRKPLPPAGPGSPTRAGTIGNLFDRYIRTSVGYAIRGVLWDQGEAGSGILGLGQHTCMSELIRGWRELWGQGDFAFLFVQKPSGLGNAWSKDDPITREADAFTSLPAIARAGDGAGRHLYTRLMLDNPNAWMVPAIDLGSMIHPLNKWGYGNRAAQVALQKVYTKPGVQAFGPIYDSHKVEAGAIRVRFTHTAGGLATRHGDTLQGFAIAGDDGKWQWADARIVDNDNVLLTHRMVPKPRHARFAWSQNRQWANLFNKAGLPALAFTTEPVNNTK